MKDSRGFRDIKDFSDFKGSMLAGTLIFQLFLPFQESFCNFVLRIGTLMTLKKKAKAMTDYSMAAERRKGEKRKVKSEEYHADEYKMNNKEYR